MARVDSGFGPSCCAAATSTSSKMDRQNIHRSNTAPTRHRQPKHTSSEKPTATSNTKPIRPASEKRSSTQRRTPPTEPRRKKSITSSEENSTKSRSRNGHGSKPSSRRTSCTIVDPSRPTRHYRIKSAQTVPTMNSRDIDDVLALHFRSCTLFQNPGSYRSDLRSPNLISPTLSPTPTYNYNNNTHSNTYAYGHSPTNSESTPLTVPKRTCPTTTATSTTTMHWTSPNTRRREYEKIDKANSGLRGLLRRFVPRCVSGPPPQRFYEKDREDAGSVRRYRMSFDEKGGHGGREGEEGGEVDEKKSMLLGKAEGGRGSEIGGKKWGCF
ncbi:hypothetical protein B0J11DRAFT_444730 [Dendryphion nanum]|uniref:Uncharacterized protein n=1 Tax=Dendryphion nanum TaxID=256645 RepID=A0A9P9DA11_9PLEO|nr:hypothetical protein B0J11DRAFT_444730 [Dendryphion nanum]